MYESFIGNGVSPAELSSINWVLSRIELPRLLNSHLEYLSAHKPGEDVRRLVSGLFKGNAIRDPYIKIISDHLGKEVFLNMCIDCMTSTDAIYSIKSVMNIFGEKSLYSREFFDNAFLKIYQRQITPIELTIVNNKNFVDSDFPELTSFLISVLPDIYSRIAINKAAGDNIPRHMTEFAIRHGYSDLVIDGEAKILKKICDQHEGYDENQSDKYSELLSKLHDLSLNHADAEIEYYETCSVVRSVGLEKAHKHIAKLEAEILLDILGNTDTSKTRNKLMYLYPQLKARFLENELGL